MISYVYTRYIEDTIHTFVCQKSHPLPSQQFWKKKTCPPFSQKSPNHPKLSVRPRSWPSGPKFIFSDVQRFWADSMRTQGRFSSMQRSMVRPRCFPSRLPRVWETWDQVLPCIRVFVAGPPLPTLLQQKHVPRPPCSSHHYRPSSATCGRYVRSCPR